MGLLNWLFKKRAPRPQSPRDVSSGKVFSISTSFITLPSIDYHGLFRHSPGKEWLLSWKDSTPDGSRGGHRDAGEGRYVLVDVEGNAVRVDARMARPNNGAVADNGTFCLEDWHFGSTLSGTFHVFSAQGTPIITKELSANILDSGISRSGRLAFCTTANSPTEDANKLFLFDLKQGRELFAVTPARACERFEFDEAALELVAKVVGGGEYRYGPDGALVDEAAADAALLRSTNYSAVIFTAESMLRGNPDAVKLECILDALIRARGLGADNNPAWKPTALKVQGLAHEALGQVSEAIRCYEEALMLNPKIGVKRKLDALIKKQR